MASSEFDLIERHFCHLTPARNDVILAIGDDCALVTPRASQQVAISTDIMVAGRHFPHDTSPFAIGVKALATNLSDLAAMGAEPAWFTLGLSLPEANEAFLTAFAQGLASVAIPHNIALIGGDTVRGPLMVSITVHGFVPVGQAIRRQGARMGDSIYVSGTLGDAGAGLQLVKGELVVDNDLAAAALVGRLNQPIPRLAIGRSLRGIANAAIDISDGLLADLGHILNASGVGAVVDPALLPLSADLITAVGRERGVQLALSSGDDYELCFTLPPVRESRLSALGRFRIPLTRIGTVVAEPGIHLQQESGIAQVVAPQGFDHFLDNDEMND
jgi:thiamine-monophosphate kinase